MYNNFIQRTYKKISIQNKILYRPLCHLNTLWKVFYIIFQKSNIQKILSNSNSTLLTKFLHAILHLYMFWSSALFVFLLLNTCSTSLVSFVYNRFCWFVTFPIKTPVEMFPRFLSIIHDIPYVEAFHFTTSEIQNHSLNFTLACGLFVCTWIPGYTCCKTYSCGLTYVKKVQNIYRNIHTVEVQWFLVCLFSGFSDCGLFWNLSAVLGDILAFFGLTQIFCNRFQSLSL